MASLLQLFKSFTPGKQLIDGGELKQMASLLMSAQDIDVPDNAGDAATGYRLTAAMNRIASLVATNDSVVLPPAVPGRMVWVDNATASTVIVFGDPYNPATGAADGIAAHGSNNVVTTGISVTTTVLANFVCIKAGEWKQGWLA